MPFLKVTFIDGCKAADFVNGDAYRQNIVLTKRLELLYIDTATGDTPFVNGRITEPVSTCITGYWYFHRTHLLPIILTCCSNVFNV